MSFLSATQVMDSLVSFIERTDGELQRIAGLDYTLYRNLMPENDYKPISLIVSYEGTIPEAEGENPGIGDGFDEHSFILYIRGAELERKRIQQWQDLANGLYIDLYRNYNNPAVVFDRQFEITVDELTLTEGKQSIRNGEKPYYAQLNIRIRQ